jgi:hypothetical protein
MQGTECRHCGAVFLTARARQGHEASDCASLDGCWGVKTPAGIIVSAGPYSVAPYRYARQRNGEWVTS